MIDEFPILFVAAALAAAGAAIGGAEPPAVAGVPRGSPISPASSLRNASREALTSPSVGL